MYAAYLFDLDLQYLREALPAVIIYAMKEGQARASAYWPVEDRFGVRRTERTRSMTVRQQFCWWQRDDGLGRCGKPVKCRSPLSRVPSCFMHYQRERRRILASQGLNSDGRPYKRRPRRRMVWA